MTLRVTEQHFKIEEVARTFSVRPRTIRNWLRKLGYTFARKRKGIQLIPQNIVDRLARELGPRPIWRPKVEKRVWRPRFILLTLESRHRQVWRSAPLPAAEVGCCRRK